MTSGLNTKPSIATVSTHPNHWMTRYPGCETMLESLKTYIRMDVALEELVGLSYVEWSVLVAIVKHPERARIEHARDISNIKTFRVFYPIDRLLEQGWIVVREKKGKQGPRGTVIFYDLSPEKADKFWTILPFVEAAFRTATRN